MNGRKGLTIIEVLIAITIIGIVFVALASLQVSSLQVTRGADQESQLLQEAVTEFEKLRTVVLENFRAYFLGCTNEAHVCPVGTPMVGETINSFDYVITRVYPATDGSGVSSRRHRANRSTGCSGSR